MHKEIMNYAAMKEASVFADPNGIQPAPTESGKRADAILNERMTADCPQVVAQFASVAQADPAKRKAHLLDGMADAIQACGCTADIIPILKETYWHTMAWSGGRTTKFATIVLDPAGVKVSASAEATWQEMHAKFVELTAGDEPPNLALKVE